MKKKLETEEKTGRKKQETQTFGDFDQNCGLWMLQWTQAAGSCL